MTGKTKTKTIQTRQARRALEGSDIQRISSGKLRGVERGHGARLLRQTAQGRQARRVIANARLAAKLCARARELADLIKLADPRSVYVGAKVGAAALDGLLEAVQAAAFARLDGYDWTAEAKEGAVMIRVTRGQADGRPA